MAAGPVGVKHPAKMLFVLTAVMATIAWILALIAIVVPWSWKNTSVFERTNIGLWKNCVEYTNDPIGKYTCVENDIDQVGSVTGGDKKCRGYFVATQFFIIAGCVWAFLTILFAAMIIGKLWSKPVVLALYVCINAFLAFSCIMISFLMWIVWAENMCSSGSAYMFPFKGYSWGWICAVTGTFFAFLAMLLAYLGFYKILLFKPFIPHEEPPMYPVVMEAPVYVEPQPYYEPVAYEYPPMATSMAPAVAYPPMLASY